MASRNEPLGFPQLLADLYARWTLDVVVEIAHAVSRDFVARPEFYKADGIAEGIVDFRMEYGSRAGLPDQAQRLEISHPLFGPSDGYPLDAASDKFRALRKPLFDACTVYAERSIADAGASMRQAVLSALELFQPYLKAFDGASVRRSHAQIVSVSDLAFAILRSPGVAQVFGVAPPPAAGWPLDANDAAGALLIRAIGEKLELPGQQKLNEEAFQRVRRVAQEGKGAIEAILSEEGAKPDGLDGLITRIYTWAVAIRDYAPH